MQAEGITARSLDHKFNILYTLRVSWFLAISKPPEQRFSMTFHLQWFTSKLPRLAFRAMPWFPEVISHCTHTQTTYPRQADIVISTKPDSCLHNFVYAIFPAECVSNRLFVTLELNLCSEIIASFLFKLFMTFLFVLFYSYFGKNRMTWKKSHGSGHHNYDSFIVFIQHTFPTSSLPSS